MRAAVIPTRDRASDFADCVDAIRPQVDRVIAVAHGFDAMEYASHTTGVDLTVPYLASVANISTMWRMGMDEVPMARWIAFLNDDAIVSRNWFDQLEKVAEATQSAGASGRRHERLGRPGSDKIAGYAFILDAMSGVRPDERMRWWYSDDAIQARCMEHSWFVTPAGIKVEHRHPDAGVIKYAALWKASQQDEELFNAIYR